METFQISLFAAFLVGLFGTVHCVAMCGGIAGSLSTALAPESGGGIRGQLGCQLGYNAGRIASYALAGAIAGLLGSLVAGVAGLEVARVLLQGLAGVFMLLLGLYLTGWWPVLKRLELLGARLWRHVEPLGRHLLPVRSPLGAVPLGLVWGWLPCGLVYSALTLAVASGGALEGAALMAAFGFGTLPSMLGAGLVTARVRTFTGTRMRVAAGLLVLLLGVASLAMLGLRLTGGGHAGGHGGVENAMPVGHGH
jgi:sulfite exporter TauE/SafE